MDSESSREVAELSRRHEQLENLTDALGQSFVRIPAGTFRMGNALSSEELVRRYGGKKAAYDVAPCHEVTLTRDFYLCRYPVRVKDFARFVASARHETTAEILGSARGFGKDGSWHDFKGLNWRKPGFSQTEDHPVVCVSWNDAQAYVNWLNETCQDDLPPGFHYALPTEAEWEYACRAGTTTEFFWGTNEAKDGREYLNAADETGAPNGSQWGSFFPFANGFRATSPVGSFKPNAWGIYDALGNVWEWCQDWFGAYPKSAVVDPIGAAANATRVIRGGSWCHGSGSCRSAARSAAASDARLSRVGFRVAIKIGDASERATSPSPASARAKTKPQTRSEGIATEGAARSVTIDGIECVFRYCPPGAFKMGSPADEAGRSPDETLRDVALTKGFWILETPVTQALWKAVRQENPSFFKGDALPVERVAWQDCAEFIADLNERDLAPDDLIFDLPTEAEWEYACRAGTSTAYYFGDSVGNDDANFNERLGATSPVKSYKPNAWGLYDALGNVWEWCLDWYGAYSEGSTTDPVGPTSGSKRVYRGGAWCYGASYCRAACRYSGAPTDGVNRVGFRLVLRTCDANKRAEIEARKEARRKAQATPPNQREATPEAAPRVETPAGAPLNVSINGVECVFRYCPPGTFLMGSPENEEGRVDVEVRRKITLTRGFWTLDVPVTQALWKAIAGDNPSSYVGNDLPVEGVNWDDVVDFIRILNKGGFAPKGFKFDLPTEAEWEYACRAGSSTPYNFGTEINADVANYDFAVGQTSPVRKYPPNAWGLYDAHGNVSEWCSDRYGGYLLNDVVDPSGSVGGSKRVLRGGSWNLLARHCRSASRQCEAPTFRNGMIGFRLILRDEDASREALEEENERKSFTQDVESTSSIDFGGGSLSFVHFSLNMEEPKNSGWEIPDPPDSPENESTTESQVQAESSSNDGGFPSPFIPSLEQTTEPQTDEAKLRAFTWGDYSSIRAGSSLTLMIKGVECVFRYCPPGTFLMGSPASEMDRILDETQHRVTLTKGYWLLETPVTQALWYVVLGNNPSCFKGESRPVENVSWEKCELFLTILNKVYFAPFGTRYDFPTEAEWEYACRAGTTTPFSFGSILNGDKANCDGCYPYGTTAKGAYLGETSPVKRYPPNAWGLYDMHGNVWEWCKDCYGDYPSLPVTDPQGPVSGSGRVIRGGGWDGRPRFCRSARRGDGAPEDRLDNVGFRLALRSAE